MNYDEQWAIYIYICSVTYIESITTVKQPARIKRRILYDIITRSFREKENRVVD